jgi:hypothetical protein
MADNRRHHHVIGGVGLGLLISVVFLSLAAFPVFRLLQLNEQVGDLEKAVMDNGELLETWDREIDAREADIDDMEHFLPSHGHPAANPSSPNPMVTPPPH